MVEDSRFQQNRLGPNYTTAAHAFEKATLRLGLRAPFAARNYYKHDSLIWGENILGYLSFDIICSSKLTVFFELRSRKTVRYSEQIMSADKYSCIFSRQIEAIVYLC